MSYQTSLVIALLATLPACLNHSSPSSSEAPSSAAPVASVPAAPASAPELPPAPASSAAPDPAPGDSSAPAPSCGAEQFVACTSGPDCARRGGVLVNAKRCYDRAAEACASLSCAHGCNIHHGPPKEIHCAPNASSSSHMKRCAGLANWACPEKMTCDNPRATTVDDAMGTCVPARP